MPKRGPVPKERCPVCGRVVARSSTLSYAHRCPHGKRCAGGVGRSERCSSCSVGAPAAGLALFRIDLVHRWPPPRERVCAWVAAQASVMAQVEPLTEELLIEISELAVHTEGRCTALLN